jgi:Mg2+-importing ATPase
MCIAFDDAVVYEVFSNNPETSTPMVTNDQFWQYPPSVVLQKNGSSETGLSSKQAARRLLASRKKEHHPPKWFQTVRLFARQFTSPLVLLLVFAATMSSALGDWGDSIILVSILFLTGSISFWQEYRASRAVEKLRAMMHINCTVLRDGRARKVQKEAVVPGDVVLLAAGDVVPGDCLVLESKDLHTNESALTGESFPVEKEPGISAADAPLSARLNALFEGSSVMSGTGRVLVVKTGDATEFGKITAQMAAVTPETSA